MIALFLFFSIVTQHFASVANVLAMAHTMAPLVIIASGLALVVFTGKLDISVRSIAFLSSAVAVLLMHDAGVGAPLAFLAALVTGALLGALNGFVVVVLGINSLIATLGSMIALRGVALQLTNAILIPLPEVGARPRECDARRGFRRRHHCGRDHGHCACRAPANGVRSPA